MIFKDFYRKKTSRIYFIILTLILTFLLILNYKRLEYIKIGNEKFITSTIDIATKEDVTEELLKIKNIKEVETGITGSNYPYRASKEGGIFYFKNPSLKDNEIIMYSLITDYFNKDGNIIEIPYKDETISFKVDMYLDVNYKENYKIAYISEEMYNKLLPKKEYYYYTIKLNDWFKHAKTEKEILKKINVAKLDLDVDEMSDYGHIENHEPILSSFDRGPSLYEDYVTLFNIVYAVFGIIFLIILIVTIHNILIDEEKSTYLYYCLGFNNQKIKTNNLIKVGSLIILSILTSSIILLIYTILF